MELIDLTKQRRAHIQSFRDNDDHSHEIIAGLYSDPSHFFYEILQNADDAEASEVSFTLKDDLLKILHNGKRLFSFEDIKSITTVGSSTKKDDVNLIGKFGAGFKSVFAVTTSPQIHSGTYHFEIVDFIVPKEIESIECGNSTIIILPFNHAVLSKEAAYQQISERLKSLESESLLFLKNIREIKWNTKEDSGHYLSEIKSKNAYIISQNNDVEKVHEYLFFRKQINIESKQLNLAVAYSFDSENGKIIPLHDTKLFVFFPTNERTRLKFLVHVPYKTTPSRESIPFSDEQNKILTTELSILIAESILEIKEDGYLDIDFLSMLPIASDENHPVYSAAFHEVKKILLNNKLLPTHEENTYTSSSEALLAGEKKLASLLEPNDTLRLFGRKNWLNTSITERKNTRELRDYLIKELEIPEISTEKFCNSITGEFIKEKSDNWILDFYSAITTNEVLYKVKDYRGKKGVLREKPIIRLEDGNHINPENESGELQVYLPSEDVSKFKTVKKLIAVDEKAKEFLKKLGLKEPDQISEIKEFVVTKYDNKKSCIPKEECKEDFVKSYSIWSKSNEYKQKEIIDILKQIYFIGGMDHNGSFTLEKPENVYFQTEKLQSWFDGNQTDNVIFLDDDLSQPEYRKFLERLGLQVNVKITGKNDIHISQHGRYKRSVDGFNPDFNIHGLEHSLKNINISRSEYLWSIILNYTNKLKGFTESKTNQRDSYNKGSEELSGTMKLLAQRYWLYGKNNQLLEISLGKIALADLNDSYEKEHENIEKLVYALGLKLDEIKEFEEKTGKKVISQEEYEELQAFKKQKEKENIVPNQSQWNPDVLPHEIIPIEDTTPIDVIETKDLSGQKLCEDMNKEIKQDSSENEADSPVKSQNSKDIGEWGELLAKKYLEKEYPNKSIIWLNQNGNTGKGYDFVIKDEQGNEIKYYEIKTKITEKPTLIEITKTQWEWAKRLYAEGNGEKYILLVISNAGTSKATLKPYLNPLKLWKEGKIEAHPVSLKL